MVRKTFSLVLFTIACSTVWSRAQAPNNNPFPLDEATIAQLQDGMASGQLTSRRLVQLDTGRINAIDRQGPPLRSVIEPNPDAVAHAEPPEPGRHGGRGW